MDRKEYHVELVTRGRTVYQVQAADLEGARRIAFHRWERGEGSDLPDLDGAELTRARVIESSGPGREDADDVVILRYIHDREQFYGPSAGDTWLSDASGDAVSAAQSASDLGWMVPDSGVPPLVDTLRAALSLNRLCAEGALVCFSRPMARAGERGEIHLYCTPEYLDRIGDMVMGEGDEPRRMGE
ncbi:MAG: hypothetical protein LBG44_05350 [Gemmatimonadota bacterium]|jgi:hypothetical protein|nr:hypothetical protein [Gemmatimonadota bacterium]